MTICIQYARPSSGQNEGEIFGLDVAVNNFLSAWFRHGRQKKFVCRPVDVASFDHFKQLAGAAGLNAETRCIGLDPRHPKENLEDISTLFCPDPLIVDPIWRRQQLRGSGFAACGLVHTMSGERIARAVGDLCLAPSDAGDALICPSEAVRDAVRNLWQIYADYLNQRFGSKFRCEMQTPVIPLGIDTDKFRQLTTAENRIAQRLALNTAQDEMIILFVGRLSFATKAHPLALWLAAERAAQKTKKKIRVVMYGYFKPKDMEPHFRNLAADIAQTATIDFVTNDDPRFPDGLWAAADIFASLSDNVQESFGLTPVEAMASGLPAIISDWDGYRGSVRDGLDGFLIPTCAPPPSAGMVIAETYYNEGNYGLSLMGAAQSTAVDIEACAKAIRILVDDDAKRLSFGENGRVRAQKNFDWQYIIRAYEDLWQELSEKRRATPPRSFVPKNWQAVHPAYPNPLQMFRSFSTSILGPQDRIRITMSHEGVKTVLKHEMNFFLPELLVSKDSMIELIEAIRRAESVAVQDILTTFPAVQHDRIYRCLGWILKHGVGVVEK